MPVPPIAVPVNNEITFEKPSVKDLLHEIDESEDKVNAEARKRIYLQVMSVVCCSLVAVVLSVGLVYMVFLEDESSIQDSTSN